MRAGLRTNLRVRTSTRCQAVSVKSISRRIARRPTSDLSHNAASVLAALAFKVYRDLFNCGVNIGTGLSGSRAEEEVEEEIHVEVSGRAEDGELGAWFAGLQCGGERSEVGWCPSRSSYTRGAQTVPKEASGR